MMRKRERLLSVLIPVLAGGAFVLLACLTLDKSVWFDESYSAYLVRGDFSEIWALTAKDVHPPLFYFCLKIWSSIFGTSEVAMRFMSVFFGCVAIVFAFHLLKKLFGVKKAAISTLALAISPVFVRYGQEMRMYTMVLMIVFAASFMLTLALESREKKYWVFYGILVSLGMWTHYFTAFAWLVQLIYIIYMRRGFRKTFKDRGVVLAYTLAILLYLPWMPEFFAQTKEVQGGFWISEMSVGTVADYATDTLIYSEAGAAKSWVAALVVLAIGLFIYWAGRIYREAKEKQGLRLVFFMAFLPPVLLMLASLPPLKPMFINRYVLYGAAFSWVVIGLILARVIGRTGAQGELKSAGRVEWYGKKVGAGALKIRGAWGWRAGAAGVMMVFLGCAVVGNVNVALREPSGYMKEMVGMVAAMAEEGEAILAEDEWIYYDAVFYSTAKHPVYFVEDWSEYEYGSFEPIREIQYNLAKDFSEFSKEHKSFWYIAKAPKKGKEVKLPSDDLVVKNEVVTGEYVAVEVER